jgi:hypothetical protein
MSWCILETFVCVYSILDYSYVLIYVHDSRVKCVLVRGDGKVAVLPERARAREDLIQLTLS